MHPHQSRRPAAGRVGFLSGSSPARKWSPARCREVGPRPLRASKTNPVRRSKDDRRTLAIRLANSPRNGNRRAPSRRPSLHPDRSDCRYWIESSLVWLPRDESNPKRTFRPASSWLAIRTTAKRVWRHAGLALSAGRRVKPSAAAHSSASSLMNLGELK